jgi:uncharacterized membrane protein
MKKNTWTILLILGVIVLLVILAGAYLIGGWNNSGWGMMGNWGPGMMHGWGFNSFGWIGMILMWLIPIGFLILVGLGISGLIRGLLNDGQKTACPNSFTEDRPSAIEILKVRYASGEITREQYQEMLSEIN